MCFSGFYLPRFSPAVCERHIWYCVAVSMQSDCGRAQWDYCLLAIQTDCGSKAAEDLDPHCSCTTLTTLSGFTNPWQTSVFFTHKVRPLARLHMKPFMAWFLRFFFPPLCWDCPNLRSRYTRVESTNKAHGFPLQCPLPVRVPSSMSLLIQLSLSSCIFIFPWGRHKAWSHGFLKSRHASSVAFPLPTRLPTLSREEMKLVVHILFWSTPTFSDSIVICPKRNNWVFIKKKKMTVSLKPNFEQMREMTF